MPDLKPDHVLVKMCLSPINPSDLIPVTGAYRHRTQLPFIPGYEGLGIVTHVLADEYSHLLGRRVIPIGSAGNWQTWKSVPVDWCVKVPDDICDEHAAMAYVNPLTALLMVRSLSPRPGDVIGITAPGSAIGRMLIRMVARQGARVVGIARSSTTRETLRHEPADIIGEDDRFPELTGGLDAVGGNVGERLAAAIRPGHPIIHYGLLSGQPLKYIGAAELRFFRLRDWVHSVPRLELQATMDCCFDEIRSGYALNPISGRYPLERFLSALRHCSKAGRNGKVLLEM